MLVEGRARVGSAVPDSPSLFAPKLTGKSMGEKPGPGADYPGK